MLLNKAINCDCERRIQIRAGNRRNEMRKIVSGLIALAMVFALVSISEAAGLPGNSSTPNNTPVVSADTHPLCWAGFCPDMNKYREMERRDTDKPRPVTPSPMGSTGF
jgi:hypothetical protein